MGRSYRWRRCFHKGAWALDTTLNSLIHEAVCLLFLSGMWFCFTGMAGIFCRNPLEAWGERGQATSRFPTSDTRSWDPLTGASNWPAVRVPVKSPQLCLTLCDSARFLNPWESPDRNTAVGCQALLRGSSQPGDQTRISYNRQGCSLPLASPGKQSCVIRKVMCFLLVNSGCFSLSVLSFGLIGSSTCWS